MLPPQFSLQEGYNEFLNSGYSDFKLGDKDVIWNSNLNKGAWDIASTKYQNAWNEYQAQLAWNREQQAIAAQNEYNSPKNQLQRYLDAGLNPSLIYGQVSPGLQSGVASYNAPRSADVRNSIPGHTEKLGNALNLIGSIGSIFGTLANMAGAVESIKNQNLQNQILQAQLPSIQADSNWKQLVNAAKFQIYHDSGEFNIRSLDSYGDWAKILFPDYYRSSSLESKTNWQNWYNEELAPILKDLQKGKADKIGTEAKTSEYNLDMLNAFPPAVRPYMAMLFQFLGLFVKR